MPSEYLNTIPLWSMFAFETNSPKAQKRSKRPHGGFRGEYFPSFLSLFSLGRFRLYGSGDQSSPVTGRHIHIRIFFPAFIYWTSSFIILLCYKDRSLGPHITTYLVSLTIWILILEDKCRVLGSNYLNFLNA